MKQFNNAWFVQIIKLNLYDVTYRIYEKHIKISKLYLRVISVKLDYPLGLVTIYPYISYSRFFSFSTISLLHYKKINATAHLSYIELKLLLWHLVTVIINIQQTYKSCKINKAQVMYTVSRVFITSDFNL